MFLTTQYLEEADVLANRVGIIDNGRIVAEGTPAALKAEIGRPSVHVIPRERGRQAAHRGGSAPLRRAARRRTRARRAPRRRTGLADVIRAMDAEGLEAADVELRAPTLDDVFLAKTGRTLEGAATGEDEARRAMSALATQVGALAQRSIVRTARQPASSIPPLIFPVALMLVNAGGLHASTQLPGFPTDSFLAFALAVPFIQGALFSTMNAGTDLARDIQTGFFSRLALTPVRGGALLAGPLAGDRRARGAARRCSTSRLVCCSACASRPAPAGIALLLVYAALVALGFGALGLVPRAAHRLGRGDAGAVPPALRLPVHLVDEHAAQPDRRRLVPLPRVDQPGLLSDRGRPEPDHHGLGRRGAGARFRRSRSCSRSCDRRSPAAALGQRLERT